MAYGVILGQTPKAEEKDTFKSPLIIEDASNPALVFKNTTNNQQANINFNSGELQVDNKVNLNNGGTVVAPNSNTDIANKQYVDNAVSNNSSQNTIINEWDILGTMNQLDIGPFSKAPKCIIVYFGGLQESFKTSKGKLGFIIGKLMPDSGGTWSLGMQGILYDSGDSSNGNGDIGYLLQSGNNFYVRCTKDSFMGSSFFGQYANKLLTIAYF